MLRFTDRPYVFKPSRPNWLVYRLAMWVNRLRILPGELHQIHSLDVCGGDAVSSLQSDPGRRVIFVANHSTHSDVEILVEAQRRVGVWGAYMAAHEVFARGRLQSWVMQRVGAFSVQRESVDRQSIKEAVRLTKEGRLSLTLFPEGNVAFTNEQLGPFMEGAAFIAKKAQRELGCDAQVVIVPTSIRVTHTEDVRGLLRRQLLGLIKSLELAGVEVTVDPDEPFYRQVEAVGGAVLYHGLKRRARFADEDLERWRKQWRGRWLEDSEGCILQVMQMILDLIDLEMKALPKQEPLTMIASADCSKDELAERLKTLRSQLAKRRFVEGEDAKDLARWDDLSVLLLRVQTYAASYLREKPSVDRCSETLEKLREDAEDQLIRPESPRHSVVFFGAPITVGSQSVRELTSDLESRVSQGVNTYCSPHVGGELF